MHTSRGALVAALAAALSGCGAPSLDDDVSAEEPLATQEQAVQSELLDTAVVSVVSVMKGSSQYYYAFVCDAFGHFQMNTVKSGDGLWRWTGWQDLGTGCIGAPSAISVYQVTPSYGAVAVFVTWNDGHLWQYKWDSTAKAPYWTNVSTAAGMSGVAPLPPVAVYGNRDLSEVSVATRDTFQQVWTVDYYDGSWRARAVQSNTAGPIFTPHRLGAPPDAELSRDGYSYLTGRKGNNVGWVARRQYGSRLNFRVQGPDFTATSTPVVALAGPDSIGVVAVHQDGTTMKHTNYPAGTVSQYFQCPGFGGPPTFSPQFYSWSGQTYEGWVRNYRGQLIMYFDGVTPQNTYFLGTTVPYRTVRFIESAITQVSSGFSLFYAGLGGELVWYRTSFDIEQYMGIKVLF